MARVGTTIEHPVTGEHIHPQADEHFEIVAGTGRFSIDGRECTATTGQRIVVAKGTPHFWWNVGRDELHAVIAFRPALRMEQFFENFFGLGKAGRTNARGVPGLLQGALLMREFASEIQTTQPPLGVQRVVLGPLAALGEILGLKGRYAEYESAGDRRPSGSGRRSGEQREMVGV
jgi:hypothetical protein